MTNLLLEKQTKLKNYFALMRLDKPIGIYLLLWPTLWALFIANQGAPSIKLVVIFILGVVVMRSAGCIINDFADRNFDGLVKRTKARPLASNSVSKIEALLLFSFLCLLALILVLFLNRTTILLSIVALLLTIIYPFTKRIIYLPQLFLGITFYWGVLMAFAASINHIPFVAVKIYAACAIWAIAYDTIYAMVDRDDDLKIGIKSSAILFGRFDKLAVLILQIIFLLLLCWIGVDLSLPISYNISLIIAAIFFLYQQFLIRHRKPEACFKAFLNNHWVGLIIFLGLINL